MPTHGPTETTIEQTPRRQGCSVEGCSCKDVRIVQRRRAAFFAAQARLAGQTADRRIDPEAGWRIPLLATLDSPALDTITD